MSLYGLDILIDKNSKHWICEINGVESGMDGFTKIYGTNKVEEQVKQILGVQSLPNDKVNDFVCEQVTQNKLLQYFIFGKTDAKEFLLPFAAKSSELKSSKELKHLLNSFDSKKFIDKPVLGYQGRGIKILDRRDIQKVVSKEKMLEQNSRRTIKCLMDSIQYGDFFFEEDLSVVQPYIDSPIVIGETKYNHSIRAIICNGRFIDSYSRVSENRVVNFSKDAFAVKFEEEGFDVFCEGIIKSYEAQCKKFSKETFKQDIYNGYFFNDMCSQRAA